MGLFERWAKRRGYVTQEDLEDAVKNAQQYPAWLRMMGGTESVNMLDPAKWENQADLYRRLTWLSIAVSKVAEGVATTPFSVKTVVDEKTEDIINHPFELMLGNPNPLMSRSELLISTSSFLDLTGNAYWFLNKASEEAEPVELWLIPSHRIQPVPDERMFLDGYLFEPGDGSKLALKTWEIAHFKRFNPMSVFVGLSPIESLAVIAVGDLKMQDWNTRLFADNNARLPGMLAFADPIENSTWEQLKKEADDSAKHRAIMMLRNVGKGGVDWIQIANTMKDMEFLAGRQFTKEEIWGAIAPGLASVLAINATEANSEAGRKTLRELAIYPRNVQLAEKITNVVLPSYGDNLRGEFDDVRITDRAIALQEQAEYAKTHTIDEIREELHNDKPIGDERGDLLPAQIGLVLSIPGEEIEPVDEEPVEPEPELPEELDEEDGEEEEIEAEVKAWRSYEAKRVGKKARPFECKHVPETMQLRIRHGLKSCKTEEDVNQVFMNLDVLPLIEAIEAGRNALVEAL